MIKIKLSNDRDIKCFSGLIIAKDMLPDYSIQLTNSNDYDYEFLDTNKFVNSSLPLMQSIDWGLENLSKKTGDYFLFHGGDSTSIMGAYEVFAQSNAKYMFKKQLLSRIDYKEPYAINKWFFGTGTVLDIGYDIPTSNYDRMKLTGYNVAHNWPQLQHMQEGNIERDIDVCAIYQGNLNNGNMDHEVRTDTLYTSHRTSAWKELEKIQDRYKIIKGQSSRDQFIEVMKRSKVGISPFGMGELCYRDLELIQWGCILIKPEMDKVITAPDFFKPYETYVPVKADWSNLNEVIEKILGNYKDYCYIIENARKKVIEQYSYENVCMHWYNFFANLNGIGNA